MKQEFREPANYNAVLQAIASGSTTLGQIVMFTQLESSLVSRYLLTLQEMNYVERIIPFDANPLKGKTSQYRISENFIAFWYRYVFSVKTEIEMGYGDIYASFALKDLNDFIVPIFEEITRQYLRRLNTKCLLPFIAKSFGRWWGKDRKGNVQEVDVVVESLTGKELLIGECQWRNSFKVQQIVSKLRERIAHFDHYKVYPYLFSKYPIQLNEGSDIRNVSLGDLYENHEEVDRN